MSTKSSRSKRPPKGGYIAIPEGPSPRTFLWVFILPVVLLVSLWFVVQSAGQIPVAPGVKQTISTVLGGLFVGTGIAALWIHLWIRKVESQENVPGLLLQIKKLATQAATERAAREGAEAIRTELARELSSLRAENNGLRQGRDRRDSFREDALAARTELEGVQERLRAALSRVDAMQSEISSLKSQRDAAVAQGDRHSASATANEAQVADLRRQLRELSADRDSKATDLGNLRRRLALKDAAQSRSGAELARITKELQDARSDSDRANAAIAEKDGALKRTRHELDSDRRDLARLREQLDSALVDRARLESELDASKDELARRAEALTQSAQALEEALAEIEGKVAERIPPAVKLRE
ncbi:MAG: hypothetical protein KDD53_08055, partial [Bdellovibrionales bacterium]|nr:hypothetical protein [Bdellovibrionales bacterium]